MDGQEGAEPFHGPGLFASARAGDLSDVAMIWVAAPARKWVHMYVGSGGGGLRLPTLS